MTTEVNIIENIKKATEVVFSFDSTGSMSSCIANVRNHIEKTCEELFENIPDLKIGFIAHGDYCDLEKCYTVLSLTNDKAKIFDFIRTTPNTCGGDSPECYELALNLAKTLGWSDAKGGKVLVMIGDEEPHEPDYPDNKDKLDWKKELNDLKTMGIDVYPLQCLYHENNISANHFWKTIAETFDTPLLKLDSFQDSSIMFTGIVSASAGTDAFRSYETKYTANSSENVKCLNAGLRSRTERYDAKKN